MRRSSVRSRPHGVISSIMGTHGRPWYQRAFLGSTAEAVLRASDSPNADHPQQELLASAPTDAAHAAVDRL